MNQMREREIVNEGVERLLRDYGLPDARLKMRGDLLGEGQVVLITSDGTEFSETVHIDALANNAQAVINEFWRCIRSCIIRAREAPRRSH